MKTNYLESHMDMKKFLTPFYTGWVILLASLGAYAYYILVVNPIDIYEVIATGEVSNPGQFVLFTLALYAAVLSMVFFLQFVQSRAILTSLHCDGSQVEFEGMAEEYVPRVVGWIFLSIITVGLYLPWAIRHIIAYFSERTSFKGAYFKFRGHPMALLFAIAIAALPVLLIDTAITNRMIMMGMQIPWIIRFLIDVLISLLFIPFSLLAARWALNFRYIDKGATLQFNLTEEIGFLFPHILLVSVTFGLYTFYLYSILLRRYLPKVAVMNENSGKPAGLSFGFAGNPWEGFRIIFGQLLLSALTLGIYYPFAIKKIVKWIMSQVYINEEEKPFEAFSEINHEN